MLHYRHKGVTVEQAIAVGWKAWPGWYETLLDDGASRHLH